MPCRWASYNVEGTHTKFRPLPSHILPIHESPTANGQLCMPHWATFVRQWNDRVRAFTSHTTSKARSDICFRHHWNLARYLATLPEHSWIRRFLGSKGQRCIGPPKYCWQAGSASYFRAQAAKLCVPFFFPPVAWTAKCSVARTVLLVSSQAFGIGLHAHWQPNSKTY